MKKFAVNARVEAFFLEFPFLNKYFKPSEINAVQVRRWDEEMLNISAVSFYAWEGTVSETNTFYLLDAEGNSVAILPRLIKRVWWNPLTWFPEPKRGLMYQFMMRLSHEKTRQVTIIVGHCWEEFEGVTLTVWKPAKGFSTLQDWLTRQFRR